MPYLYLLSIVLLLIWPFAGAQGTEILAIEHRGGQLPPNEGGMVMTIVPSRSLAKKDAGTSVIKFVHEPTKRVYKIEFDLGLDFRRSPKIHRLPRGSYRIIQLVVNSEAGLHQYRGPHDKVINIDAGKISQIGRWVVVERKNRRLEILYKPVKNRPKSKKKNRSKLQVRKDRPQKSDVRRRTAPGVGTALDDNTVVGSRSRQSMLPQLSLPSDGDSRQGSDARITYTVTQTISMLYKIDLQRHNRYARYVQAGIQSVDAKLRQCYGDRLGVKEDLKGSMHFKFIYSKVEKSFRSIKTLEDTTNDPRFVECVYWVLGDAEFRIGTDLIGDVTFFFNVK